VKTYHHLELVKAKQNERSSAMKRTGLIIAVVTLVLGGLLVLTVQPAFAQASIVLFNPTLVTRTCDNPASGFANPDECSLNGNIGRLWVFEEKAVNLTCAVGDTATLSAVGDPNDEGTGVIVDNLMQVNGVNVCDLGDGAAPLESPAGSFNCFNSGGVTTDIPVQDKFTGIGTIALPVGNGPDDIIPLGSSTVNFSLHDWGRVYGNSRIVLETTCQIEFVSSLDIDGNGKADALTDGIVGLRFLFKFLADTLVGGNVVAADCTRCTAQEIEEYLTDLGLLLDVDGNGQADALTDGILVLRFLFQFTGDALVSGNVVAPDCTRCTAEEIEPFLQGLMP